MRSFVYFSQGGDASTAAHGMRAPPSAVRRRRGDHAQSDDGQCLPRRRGAWSALYCSTTPRLSVPLLLLTCRWRRMTSDRQMSKEHPTNGIVCLVLARRSRTPITIHRTMCLCRSSAVGTSPCGRPQLTMISVVPDAPLSAPAKLVGSTCGGQRGRRVCVSQGRCNTRTGRRIGVHCHGSQ